MAGSSAALPVVTGCRDRKFRHLVPSTRSVGSFAFAIQLLLGLSLLALFFFDHGYVRTCRAVSSCEVTGRCEFRSILGSMASSSRRDATHVEMKRRRRMTAGRTYLPTHGSSSDVALLQCSPQSRLTAAALSSTMKMRIPSKLCQIAVVDGWRPYLPRCISTQSRRCSCCFATHERSRMRQYAI